VSAEDQYRINEAADWRAKIAQYNANVEEAKRLIPLVAAHLSQNSPPQGGWFLHDGVKRIGWDVFDPYADGTMYFLTDGTVVVDYRFASDRKGPWSEGDPAIVSQVLVVGSKAIESLQAREAQAQAMMADVARLLKWLKKTLPAPPPPPSQPSRRSRSWWRS
jgi:hypothetical protein